MRKLLASSVFSFTLAAAGNGLAAEGTFSALSITPEAAYEAAAAALAACRKGGFQVSVAVVDRGGNPVVLLRDRYAGPHTIDLSIGKARTAVSFKAPTGEMVAATQPGNPESGMRNVPGVVMLGGGIPMAAEANIVGGIGVSGAPAGAQDETCAQVGLDAVEEKLAF